MPKSRYFWVRMISNNEVTIAELCEPGTTYQVPGSDEIWYDAADDLGENAKRYGLEIMEEIIR